MSSSDEVFPLKLTPFEYYMYLDDSRRYPMTFTVQMEISGQIDRTAFDEALEEALVRHPLLRALVEERRWGRAFWIDGRHAKTGGHASTMVHWGTRDEEIVTDDGEYIDLRHEVGLRIWIRHDQADAVITMQFHHSCTDGAGAYQFMGDLLWSYARRTGDDAVGRQLPVDPAVLINRTQATCKNQMYDSWNEFTKIEWGEIGALLFQAIAPMRPHVKRAKKDRAQPVFPGFITYEFDKEEYREIRLGAQNLGHNANDFLLEKLFQSLKQWNEDRGSPLRHQKLCILMPLDLRDAVDIQGPCANYVAYATIRRGRKILESRSELARSLREELMILKRDRHHSKFMNLIVRAQAIPGLLKQVVKVEKCMNSAVFSNAGDPSKRFRVELPRVKGAIVAGNLTLQRITGVPPLRVQTRLTVSLSTYRRSMIISMRCDPHTFTVEDTRAFLAHYLDTVRKALTEAQPPIPKPEDRSAEHAA